MVVTTPGHGQRDPVAEKAMDAGPDAQKAFLHDYFKDAGWQAERILAGMDECDDFYMSRMARVRLPTWTKHRATLLGDAAHATFGVGTTLAIEGAYFLAGELSKIKSTDDVPGALKAYEKAFQAVIAKEGDLPPGYPQLAFPQTAWGIKVRDAIAWTLCKSKAYKLLPGDQPDESNLPPYEWVSV